jgi:hypothetical protein
MSKREVINLLEDIKLELIDLCEDNEVMANSIEDYMDKVINKRN